jgi:hypothetical protein
VSHCSWPDHQMTTSDPVATHFSTYFYNKFAYPLVFRKIRKKLKIRTYIHALHTDVALNQPRLGNSGLRCSRCMIILFRAVLVTLMPKKNDSGCDLFETWMQIGCISK